MLGVSTGSMAGSSVLRILQTLNSLTLVDGNKSKGVKSDGNQEHVTMCKLHMSLEPLWQELSECIGVTKSQLGQGSLSSVVVNANVGDPPLPLRTQRQGPGLLEKSFSILLKAPKFMDFNKEKVPLEGFKALQRISGPRQRFRIYKAYGAPEWLPSAHTCFNQLDLLEYKSKEQL
nr:E3 ubiquitin-protein ligase UPL1-like [Tanacetum cinerariifolium]